MPRGRDSSCRDASARRECHSVARRRVEDRFLRLPFGNNRCPYDVDHSGLIDRDGRTILRATVELPLVFAHSNERTEMSTTVCGFREGDVAHASWKDVPPGSVHRATSIDGYRGLTAKTHIRRDDRLGHATLRRERPVIDLLRRLAFVFHAAMLRAV